jgi:hypothetical protein
MLRTNPSTKADQERLRPALASQLPAEPASERSAAALFS